MAETETGALTPPDDREFSTLAREMSKAYAKMVDYYSHDLGLAPAEADRLARDLASPNNQAAVEQEPADQVSWWKLSSLAESDPECALRIWERIKVEAQAQLASGHRVAEVVDWDTSPWDRARFLALRTAFRAEWAPHSGVEDALLDSMALSFSAYLYWMGSMHVQWSMSYKTRANDLRTHGLPVPPRMDGAEALEMAATMADRFHKMFLRTVRALRDLRRYAPTVLVQNAGQVNVGPQQWNVETK